MNAPVSLHAFEARYRQFPDATAADVAHIPGPPSSPLPFVNTIAFLKDPLGHGLANYAKYGPVYRHNNFGGWGISLVGPEANELILFNRDRIFSSEQGWMPLLYRLFPHGLMLMDDPHHRVHRKTLGVAFKPEPMQNYLNSMRSGIARGIAAWPQQFTFYPAIKKLTLDLAATSFLGIPWGPEADRINTAFVDMVQASVGVIRKPVPGSQMWKGVRGRKLMSEFFAREIPKRRGAAGDDIFTQVCNAEHDEGRKLSDQEIIDHMNFLMMAAHDTLTSSLTSTIYMLAKHGDWQQRVREEILALRAEVGAELPYERLDDLQYTEMAFKEALRIIPPVPSIPRRAVKDFEFGGFRFKAGMHFNASPMITHRLPEIWPEPEQFDPLRFTTQNSRGRHKYAWVPFGGGAHMCLGLHFAYLQAKAFLFELLSQHEVTLAPGYRVDLQMFPIPKPRDGLPVTLTRIAA